MGIPCRGELYSLLPALTRYRWVYPAEKGDNITPHLRCDPVQVGIPGGVVHPQKTRLIRVTGRDHVEDIVNLGKQG